MIRLSKHDRTLADIVQTVIEAALAEGEYPVALAKRIAAISTRHRNRGRVVARRQQPFQGICEASGLPLSIEDAVLDEIEPERGYAGRVRWVCPRANNSGRHSCGGC
jgi:hypothetical protein